MGEAPLVIDESGAPLEKLPLKSVMMPAPLLLKQAIKFA
jgi:hypothetical protein